jgi:hypothetical protein
MGSLRSALLFFLCVCAGCAGVDVRATVSPEANLARYHTYAWYQVDGAPRTPESPTDQHIRRALSADLARHKVVLTSGEPDFLVAYHVIQPESLTVTDWGDHQHGWAPHVTSYSQGTLVFDFIDRQTNKIFWRGTASGVVIDPRTVDERRIDRAVHRLVADYASQRETVRPRM